MPDVTTEDFIGNNQIRYKKDELHSALQRNVLNESLDVPFESTRL
jgi:hypothetical protein